MWNFIPSQIYNHTYHLLWFEFLFLLIIVSISVGIVSLVHIKRKNQKGAWMAISGFVLIGIQSMLGFLFMLMLSVDT
jgi:hypothetical protein